MELNSTGEDQAKSAGQHLQDEKFDLVVSSDLVRAKKTCTLILQQNNHHRVQIDNSIRKVRYVEFLEYV